MLSPPSPKMMSTSAIPLPFHPLSEFALSFSLLPLAALPRALESRPLVFRSLRHVRDLRPKV